MGTDYGDRAEEKSHKSVNLSVADNELQRSRPAKKTLDNLPWRRRPRLWRCRQVNKGLTSTITTYLVHLFFVIITEIFTYYLRLSVLINYLNNVEPMIWNLIILPMT